LQIVGGTKQPHWQVFKLKWWKGLGQRIIWGQVDWQVFY